MQKRLGHSKLEDWAQFVRVYESADLVELRYGLLKSLTFEDGLRRPILNDARLECVQTFLGIAEEYAESASGVTKDFVPIETKLCLLALKLAIGCIWEGKRDLEEVIPPVHVEIIDGILGVLGRSELHCILRNAQTHGGIYQKFLSDYSKWWYHRNRYLQEDGQPYPTAWYRAVINADSLRRFFSDEMCGMSINGATHVWSMLKERLPVDDGLPSYGSLFKQYPAWGGWLMSQLSFREEAGKGPGTIASMEKAFSAACSADGGWGIEFCDSSSLERYGLARGMESEATALHAASEWFHSSGDGCLSEKGEEDDVSVVRPDGTKYRFTRDLSLLMFDSGEDNPGGSWKWGVVRRSADGVYYDRRTGRESEATARRRADNLLIEISDRGSHGEEVYVIRPDGSLYRFEG